MESLILGAGYATRLYPLTRERPKPLLPIGGVPILTRICDQIWKVKGLKRVSIVTNHRFVSHYYSWLKACEQARALPAPVEIFDDLTTSNDDRLGAIGDIDFVVRHAKIDDDLLVVAGDNLIDLPLQEFVDFARPKGSAICLKDLQSTERVSLYGVVELDRSGKVVDFEEKPPVPRSTLISTGIYYFGRKQVPLVAQYLAEGNSKDRPGDYLTWLYQKIDLHGYVTQGAWYDIGDIDSYNSANEQYMRKSDLVLRPGYMPKRTADVSPAAEPKKPTRGAGKRRG